MESQKDNPLKNYVAPKRCEIWPRNGCDSMTMTKMLIITIWVNLMPNSGEM